MNKFLTFISLTLHTLFCIAQQDFNQSQNITVTKDGEELTNPWAGGLNVPQYSSIDLNQDGILDLFIFDKNGNQISCFINNGTNNVVDYHYSPEYHDAFPSLEGWALLRDYNCDDKEDLFTSYNGAIKLYKNTSIDSDLSFEDMGTITTDRGEGPTNLYVSSVDIPHIGDLDNDDDIDILTFTVIGSNVELHKNMSYENGYGCDSIQIEMTDNCWGDFSENFSNNSVTLNDCSKSESKHSGSTVTAIDLNGDTFFELLLGDITFDNMVMLENSAEVNTALMVNQDENFPSYDQSINIPKFPAAYHIDVNNDGNKDLIVSPNGDNVSFNINNSWYYKNTSDTEVNLMLQQKNFLADNMIDVGSGAHPVLFDYNNDSLMDLIVANFGYSIDGGNFNSQLALYENTGTQENPSFTWITDDYANLAMLNSKDNMIPTFGDIDNDGDKDMILGDSDGNLHLMTNIEIAGETSFFMNGIEYFDIDVGSFASPFLVDLDRDGDLDLIVGSRKGLIYYYQNVGTANEAIFELENDTLGGINLIDPIFNSAYTTPIVVDTESGYELFVGTEKGMVHHFNNIDDNVDGIFTELIDTYEPHEQGVKTSVAVYDINSDGILDMIKGILSGGLHLYLSDTVNDLLTDSKLPKQLFTSPNPASGYVNVTHNAPIKKIVISNLKGQYIATYYNTNRVNITNLRSGMYIFKIIDSNDKIFYHKQDILR